MFFFHGQDRKIKNQLLVLLVGGEHPPPPLEKTEATPTTVGTEGQQMNGILEDRSSVSSTDLMVSNVNN